MGGASRSYIWYFKLVLLPLAYKRERLTSGSGLEAGAANKRERLISGSGYKAGAANKPERLKSGNG